MGENSHNQKTTARNGAGGTRGTRRNGAGGTRNIIREFSAGGVIFKGNKWLVRATNPSKLFPKIFWGLPKGWIDDDPNKPHTPGPMAGGLIKADEESLQKAALRETAEEAGINTKIIKKIGTHKYFFTHPTRGPILKFATFYLMEYLSDRPEGFDNETSEVLWLPFDQAYKKITTPAEKQTLKKANELLDELKQKMPL